MNVEQQLRGAMHAASDHLNPDEGASFTLVRRRGLAARRRRTAQLGGLVGVLVVASVSVAATRLAGDGRSVVAPGRPSTTAEMASTTVPRATTAVAPAPVAPTTGAPQSTAPSTSAAPASSPAPTTSEVSPTPAAPATTPPPAAPVVAGVIWPGPEHDLFLDAVSAARSFVDEFIGMPNAALGELRLEQPGVGEVDVHGVTESGAPMDAVVSTITIRQVDGHWYVTGAGAADVQIDTPDPNAEVSSPLRVEGRGRGYEGTIVVQVRDAFQPAGQQLGQDVTVAGCCDELAPFNAVVTLSAPTGQTGAIIASTDTGAEHGVVDFTVIPVRFVPASGEAGGITTLRVFFTDYANGASRGLVEVARTVPKTTGVLRASLVALLDGPTADERAAGLLSWFPDNSGGAIEGVTLDDGRATVRLSSQLAELAATPPPDDVLAQLNATVFQFDNVQTVRYELGDSCETFDRWLGRGCEFTRDGAVPAAGS